MVIRAASPTNPPTVFNCSGVIVTFCSSIVNPVISGIFLSPSFILISSLGPKITSPPPSSNPVTSILGTSDIVLFTKISVSGTVVVIPVNPNCSATTTGNCPANFAPLTNPVDTSAATSLAGISLNFIDWPSSGTKICPNYFSFYKSWKLLYPFNFCWCRSY